jgi:hypothetical protein
MEDSKAARRVRREAAGRASEPPSSRTFPLVGGALYLAALEHVLAADEEDLVPAGAAGQEVAGVVVGDAVGSAADEVVALTAVYPVLAVAAVRV